MVRTPILVPRVNSDKNHDYGYIYITTNLVNYHQYIGQHRYNTEGGYIGSGVLLKQSIEKYGKQNFRNEIIDVAQNQLELDEKEIFWIGFLKAVEGNSWYNLAEGGFKGVSLPGELNPMYGVHRPHTEKEKCAQRERMMGHWVSEDTRQKLRNAMNRNKDLYQQCGSDNPFYGKNHTEEQKKLWRKSKGTPIVQLTLSGEYVAEFDSMTEPEELGEGFSHTYISNCCKGLQTQHKGYLWVYKSDYEKSRR